MKNIIIVSTLALTLGGCGSTAPNTNASDPINLIGSSSVIVNDVQLVDSAPPSAIAISGIDCRNKVWDPVPTSPRAIETLKAEAQELGRTRVFVRSIEPHPAPISINCWSALVARGLAY